MDIIMVMEEVNKRLITNHANSNNMIAGQDFQLTLYHCWIMNCHNTFIWKMWFVSSPSTKSSLSEE